eukprot:TRINITY_DN63_c0_g1_i7.p1 TRINITY_DN63_c0_g1~~TRINITY_DN63_c0_g1_i7.p1  ORF type:complete len:531 (+),score=123.33 TRINITY_DN63_c0_g1_i7:59-1594(+)
MLLSVALTAAALSGLPTGWTSNVVYRVTPINYTGLVNMDSSDAAGDVMFGLNQLLLPFMCPLKPDFLWCQNRQYLSGGSAHMVYSSFNLESKAVFGDYAACNPDPQTGIFGCTHFSNASGLPKQCRNNYFVNHFDCYNGTIYKEVEVKEGMGGCCSACTDDAHCEAWNMPNVNGTRCQLLTNPIVTWGDARTVNPSCTAASKSHSTGFACWYDNPDYNVTFDKYCSRSECNCEAVDWLSVGRELHAMCFKKSSEEKKSKKLPQPVTATDPSDYWKCNDLLFQHCADTLSQKESCLECAKRSSLPSTCEPDWIDSLCSASLERCNSTVVSLCGPITDIATCRDCAFSEKFESQMIASHCNNSLINDACMMNDPSSKADQYEEWIMNFGCLMNGTWYSTTDNGYCNGTITDDCWWNVDGAIRTVNQTCVDGNVVNAVYNYNSTCFQTCPQPHNISTNCVVDCLFINIFGENGAPPMDTNILTDAFLKSFSETDPSEGGCPEIRVPPHDHDDEF